MNKHKRIDNNVEYIIGLFKFYCDGNLDEFTNFKQYHTGDLVLYLNHNAKSLMIYYDEFNDEYILCDLSLSGNKKGSHKYHIQKKGYTLPSIIRFVSTLHR